MEYIILKSKAIPEISFLSLVNHLQSCMDFFVSFIGNVNLFRVLYSGIRYKFMPPLVFVPFDFIQTDDTVQILASKVGFCLRM